ncbi:MAG: MbtH family NRPS accessory protein [Candidatus Aminicenantes bacterium]|jgi:MbtH protein
MPNKKAIYKLVVNHEEQYSLCHLNRELEPGWQMVGKTGTKEECLKYLKKIRPDIEEVWTDMRPVGFHEPTKTVGQL